MRSVLLALINFVAIVLASPVSAATPLDLNGRWVGTWYVDEWFYAPTGEPILNPPLENVGIDLVLHGFDGEDYGELTLFSTLDILNTGTVSSVSVDSSHAVSILIEYPQLGLGYPTGEIAGVLNGRTIIGDFDEFPAPVPDLIGFKGPMMISAVPEAPTWAMWFGGIGLLSVLARGRRAGAAVHA